jgi:hypothetical protein
MNTWFYQGQLGLFFFELEKMKDVVERVLSVIDDEIESANVQFKTQSEVIPDEGLGAVRDDLWVLQNLIPRHIINALFLSFFSLFEDEMVKICERIGDKRTVSISFRDYKDRNKIGLSKCRSYFNKCCQIHLGDYHSWEEITNIKGLRNMIAHNNGRFENRNQQAAERLQVYIDKSEFLSMNEFQDIIVDRRYLKHVESVFMTFMKNLIPTIEDRKLV